MKIKLITGEILGITKLEALASRDPETGAIKYRCVATLKDGRDLALQSQQFEIVSNVRDFNPKQTHRR
jgi:hypothetical protein